MADGVGFVVLSCCFVVGEFSFPQSMPKHCNRNPVIPAKAGIHAWSQVAQLVPQPTFPEGKGIPAFAGMTGEVDLYHRTPSVIAK